MKLIFMVDQLSQKKFVEETNCEMYAQIRLIISSGSVDIRQCLIDAQQFISSKLLIRLSH